MAIQFQQLGPGDGEVLAATLSHWPLAAVVGRATLRREAERVLQDPGQWHTWLLRRDGATIGYLMLQFRGGSLFEHPRAQVAALYVEPAARTAELAQTAMRFAGEVARWLHVHLVREEAPRLDRHAPAFTEPLAVLPRWVVTTPAQEVA